MLANIAYFAGATKEEIVGSGRLVAALLFRNVYGPKAERALSVFVALSALGNVLSVIFSQGRVNQELGREGILPLSKFWGSNKPFNAPLAGLGLRTSSSCLHDRPMLTALTRLDRLPDRHLRPASGRCLQLCTQRRAYFISFLAPYI